MPQKKKAPPFFTGEEDLKPFGLGLKTRSEGRVNQLFHFGNYTKVHNFFWGDHDGNSLTKIHHGERLKGVAVKDLILTPLGLIGTVLGVKYLEKGNMDTGVLWVEYKDGFRSPLEKSQKTADYPTRYARCAESDHVWRDVADYNKKMFKVNESHYIVHELNRQYRQELIDEDNKKKEAAEKKKLKQKNKKKKTEPDAVPPPKK